jgi:hypothetical protein
MIANTYIGARVTADTKARFAAVAERQGLSESALLKRLIDTVLMGIDVPPPVKADPVQPIAKDGKLSVRLRSDDFLLLRERAVSRQLPTGTYVSLLIRSHLRKLAPIPSLELEALRRSVAEVGAIGRNLNQIARAVNQGAWPTGPSRSDLQALLRALTALRDHTKSVINTNLASWEAGDAQTNS